MYILKNSKTARKGPGNGSKNAFFSNFLRRHSQFPIDREQVIHQIKNCQLDSVSIIMWRATTTATI